MAFVDLTPITFNATVRKSTAQSIFSAGVIKDSSGAAVDLSAWNDILATMRPLVPNPTGSDANFDFVAGTADGKLKLYIPADTSLDGVNTGSCQLIVNGKASSGDEMQLLASGTLNIVL